MYRMAAGVIAVDVAEVALTLDQRIPRCEILRHSHHGVVNRGVAMRVIFTHDIADNAGTLLEAGGRIET